MKVYTAPEALLNTKVYKTRIFLAGSIEMGKAVDWQQDIINQFDINRKSLDVCKSLCIYNPRRRDWDSSWEQSVDNAQFHRQVSWELAALEDSTHIIMYLQPGTISPISLLELGAFKDKMTAVICPEGFHRRGNVQIFCERYKINLYDSLDGIVNDTIFAV